MEFSTQDKEKFLIYISNKFEIDLKIVKNIANNLDSDDFKKEIKRYLKSIQFAESSNCHSRPKIISVDFGFSESKQIDEDLIIQNPKKIN